MAYQSEYFTERYGARATEATPPIKKIRQKGVKTSIGADASAMCNGS